MEQEDWNTEMENKGWSWQTQGARNQCTHWGGNLGRPPAWLRVSERRGLGNRPRGAFCASSRHIPISHGYLYSSPNWKVGLWTICMRTHTHTLLLFLPSSRSFATADTAAKQLLTPSIERPDMLRLLWKTSQEAKFALIRNDSVKGWIQNLFDADFFCVRRSLTQILLTCNSLES